MVRITRYIGKGNKVVIPEYIRDMPVIGMKKELFSGHEELVDVTLPSTLSAIGDYVFDGCTGIEKINIPDSVVNKYIKNCR